MSDAVGLATTTTEGSGALMPAALLAAVAPGEVDAVAMDGMVDDTCDMTATDVAPSGAMLARTTSAEELVHMAGVVVHPRVLRKLVARP